MIPAKVQPQGILDSGEEDFSRFLPYMGMAAILVNGPRPFKQSFVPLPWGGSIWNLSKIGSAASEEKSFENVNGRTDGRTKSDHNSSSWAELRWPKKKKKQPILVWFWLYMYLTFWKQLLRRYLAFFFITDDSLKYLIVYVAVLWARVVAYVILEKSIEFEIYSHILYYLNLNKDYINHVINIVTETLFLYYYYFSENRRLSF